MTVLSNEKEQLVFTKKQQPKQQKNLAEVAEEKPSLVRASFQHSSTSSLSCSSNEDTNDDVIITSNNAGFRNSTYEEEIIQYPTKNLSNDSKSLLNLFWEFLCGTFNLQRLCKSNLKWGHKRSKIVGASCFLFLLPVPSLYKYLHLYWTAIGFGFVTITSFCSDYVYTGLDSIFHGIDRALASTLFLRMVVFATSKAFSSGLSSSQVVVGEASVVRVGGNNAWILAGPVVAIASFLNSVSASRKGNYERWVVWHSLWHVAASGIVALVSYLCRDVESVS